MEQGLRKLARDRAGNKCEYCGMHQEDDRYFSYHVKHIVPRQHAGATIESNLAWACYHCNLHKGPNLTGIDPETSKIVPLFHPRQERWSDHFVRRGIYIVGLTGIGRATVRVLAMNERRRLQLRSLSRRD